MASNNDDRTADIIACTTITTVAVLVAVSLRIYVRLAIVRNIGPDDYTIILSTICSLLCFSSESYQASRGLGKHMSALTPSQQLAVTKWSTIDDLPGSIGVSLSKISIALLLQRLLGRAATPLERRGLQGINVFVCVYTLVWLINHVTFCIPIQKHFDPTLTGTCRSRGTNLAFTYFQTDNVVPFTIWATLELNFAIIGACIPTLRPLVRYFDGNNNKPAIPESVYIRQSDTTHGLRTCTIRPSEGRKGYMLADTERESQGISGYHQGDGAGIRKTTDIRIEGHV
ncbi:MAG: hypothetical protein Q9168_006280 [Polycauliona sp. 1 TL-2023]